MKTRIPSAAYHEAGHAVAAFMLGMHVDLVSIETEGLPPGWLLRGGVMASFDHDDAQNRVEAERAATAGLAGEQAERLWSEQKPWRRVKSTRHVSFSGDRAYVEAMLLPFIKDSVGKQLTIKRLKAAARTLLVKHWNSVEILAATLAERKVLNRKEIARLVALKN